MIRIQLLVLGALHSQGGLLFPADGGLGVLDGAWHAQSIATGKEGNVEGA